ncbi:AMP-dependent synthetase and ligase [Parafrankia sp. EAN1pec]|uniref:AMP-binding protein n=1 Tax=Parafrankia sp. (strain EAN1pec) TaxID=298653 RepID=UPI00015D9D44|nr:AMP-dependent synthetase and ligase [Frankia sp. EAN1pec]
MPGTVEPAAHPGSLHRPATQADLLVRSLTRDRSRPVLYMGDDVLTAGQFADEISRYVQAWQDWGITVGSGVAILSPNRPEVLISMGAALVAGVVWTPLHPLGSLEDQAFILADAGVETLLFDPVAFGDRAAQLGERAPSLKRLIALAPTNDAEDIATRAAQFGARHLSAPNVRLSDPSWIVYTGGTTGRPKGVVTTHQGIATMTDIQMAEWDWPRELRTLCVTPLSHASSALFLPTVLRGGSLVVTSSFDPDQFLVLIKRYRITATFLVPTMIYRLLDHHRLRTADLSSLETLFYGASAMSPSRLAEAMETLGPIFFQFYGQAECPMTVTVLRKKQHHPDRLASCGQPVPWLDVALLDDDGREVDTGEPGEICVRGPLVMARYHNQPDQTAEAFRHGWLHTGDIATADHDGFLTIVDRKKDMIVTGGFNIFPREVEDVLATHPEVSAAAVIGVPDPIWGEAVKAVVVRCPGASVRAEDLVRLVKERKGPAAAPKSVDFVDTIPLSPLGKPDKKALRAAHWTGSARNVS